jgi:hypothetical protein
MREHHLQGIPGVWVDECHGCGGFFLDAGSCARSATRSAHAADLLILISKILTRQYV